MRIYTNVMNAFRNTGILFCMFSKKIQVFISRSSTETTTIIFLPSLENYTEHIIDLQTKTFSWLLSLFRWNWVVWGTKKPSHEYNLMRRNRNYFRNFVQQNVKEFVLSNREIFHCHNLLLWEHITHYTRLSFSSLLELDHVLYEKLTRTIKIPT